MRTELTKQLSETQKKLDALEGNDKPKEIRTRNPGTSRRDTTYTGLLQKPAHLEPLIWNQSSPHPSSKSNSTLNSPSYDGLKKSSPTKKSLFSSEHKRTSQEPEQNEANPQADGKFLLYYSNLTSSSFDEPENWLENQEKGGERESQKKRHKRKATVIFKDQPELNLDDENNSESKSEKQPDKQEGSAEKEETTPKNGIIAVNRTSATNMQILRDIELSDLNNDHLENQQHKTNPEAELTLLLKVSHSKPHMADAPSFLRSRTFGKRESSIDSTADLTVPELNSKYGANDEQKSEIGNDSLMLSSIGVKFKQPSSQSSKSEVEESSPTNAESQRTGHRRSTMLDVLIQGRGSVATFNAKKGRFQTQKKIFMDEAKDLSVNLLRNDENGGKTPSRKRRRRRSTEVKKNKNFVASLLRQQNLHLTLLQKQRAPNSKLTVKKSVIFMEEQKEPNQTHTPDAATNLTSVPDFEPVTITTGYSSDSQIQYSSTVEPE